MDGEEDGGGLELGLEDVGVGVVLRETESGEGLVDVGVDAGVNADVDAGVDAGVDADVDADVDAEVDADVDVAECAEPFRF
jgi:hypothetical protein